MPSLQLTNTLTRKKETFVPLHQNNVGLYVCGITPYDEPHLGHARCYVVFDVLKRVLEYTGYKVKHIQNYTDIDDKIIDRAAKEGVSPAALAEKNISSFELAMEKLNVRPADDYPRVTTSIPLIVNLIQKLVERGFAYELEGDVYYKVRQFESYGQLSKRKIDDLNAGARVEVDERKKDPLDFALWKKAKPGEPFWTSPWGEGRPGWHIECSAMSMDRLGDEFDIHGGGQDLIFPHHENEVAQSIGATGKKFAHVWVHNGFVTINQEKMSKSLGNFFTIKDIVAKFDPMAVRYFLLTQHYRSPLNFSDHDLNVAQGTWTDRIVSAFHQLRDQGESSHEAYQLEKDFYEALKNDLNTPAALGALNQLATLIFRNPNSVDKKMFTEMLEILGLVVSDESWQPEILELVTQRESAKKEKNWKQADEIRSQLKSKGIVVDDTPKGPRLKKI